MIQTVKDLLVRQLNEIRDAEFALLKLFPQMAGECPTDDARNVFLAHAGQTQQQIDNIGQCLRLLGGRAQPVPCEEIAGMEHAHQSFVGEDPAPDVLALFDLDKALKAKQYEIASYRMLIDMSNLLAHGECARLLEQNLNQEQEMARRLQQMSRLVAQQTLRRSSTSWQMGAP